MTLSESTAAADATSDPGWKPHPVDPGREMFWDGSAWTKRERAADPEVELVEEDERLVKWGLAMAFLFPLIGFVLGVISAARGRRLSAGVAVMFTAIVMSWVWLAIYVQIVVDDPSF